MGLEKPCLSPARRASILEESPPLLAQRIMTPTVKILALMLGLMLLAGCPDRSAVDSAPRYDAAQHALEAPPAAEDATAAETVLAEAQAR